MTSLISRPLWRAAALLLALASAPSARAADEFLTAEKAFPLAARVLDAQHIELRFDIAPGYYLYRDKFSAVAQPDAARVGALQIPPGKTKYDENFQKDVAYFTGSTPLILTVPAGGEPFQVVVGNQGCADKGLCYPPMKRTLKVSSGPGGVTAVALTGESSALFGGTSSSNGTSAGQGAGQGGAVLSRLTASVPVEPTAAQTSASAAQLTTRPIASPVVVEVRTPEAASQPETVATAASDAPAPTAFAAPTAAPAETADVFSRALQSRSWFTVLGAFVFAGLLLALTPCMYPMYPILSSIVLGQSAPLTRGRGFLLALAYSQGMAVVYTALGIAAALVGGGLGGALQNPWVLGGFAILLVVFALAMFDAFELQVPQALQGRLTQWSNGVQGGRYLGVFVMGGLSALIVGPCIGPPLAGALLYIGQTQDVLLGAVALYAMALGMSVPLLLIGLSAGAMLPRAGGWMRHVKHFFGAMLLAAALWMVAPVIPPWALMLLVAALMLAVGVYLGAFEPLHGHPTPGRAITKGLGLVLAVLAALLLLGVVSGGRSLLQPLAHWSAASGNLLPGARAAAVGGSPSAALAFQPVRSVDELAQAVRASTRPVMVDFYADWCVACKELEAFTFTDPAVREQLAGMTLLRVDLTANNVLDQALLRHYQLFGPPALLFFPPGGTELSGSRVIGFMGADKFNAHLGRMAPLLRPAAKS